MPQIEISSGNIDYDDTGGDGPVLVFTHGLPMDGEQWREVVPLLSGYRCIRPTLPLGAHRTPMQPEADVSQRGVALMLADFLDALELRDVTLIANDWGGALFVVSEGRDERVARLVAVACEAFDNFPPGSAKKLAKVVGLPGAAWMMFQAHRLGWVRRMSNGYGAMSVRGIPDDLMDRWFAPARLDSRIRRDFVRFATSTPDSDTLLRWFELMRDFDRPVLVVWAGQDKMMPRAHGRRLADLFVDSEFVMIGDSATLIPLDQPRQLAEVLIHFLVSRGAHPIAAGGAL